MRNEGVGLSILNSLFLMDRIGFRLEKISQRSRARLGILRTAHGLVHTPFFMPIATKGAVKGLEAREVADLGAQIILSNTYHLYLQPGLSAIKKFGGLHRFMQSPLPILTDSGGFQVFSLSKLRKVDADGVTFRSHLDGSTHRLTPKKSIAIQAALCSDIMLVLDYFPGYPATVKKTEEAVRLTSQWARISFAYKKTLEKKDSAVKKQLFFGIVQGSTHRKLREQSAKELTALDFDGFAVGGLAVGEPAQEMYKVLNYTVPLLPEDKPRYLLGAGYPEQIVEAVKRGIDMFDCVIPTREGRHGRLFVWRNVIASRAKQSRGKKTRLPRASLTLGARNDSFYSILSIRNAEFKNDTKPVDSTCDCPLCYNYSRAYLHHLFRTQDYLGQRLATMHNLRFYLQLMVRIRLNIKRNQL